MAGRYGIILITLLILTGLFNTANADWTPAERISDECTVFGPRIAANDDYLHVLYDRYGDGDDRIYYLRSSDRGHNWESPLLMIDTLVNFATIRPNIKVNNNMVFALWKNSFRSGGGRNITFRKSTNSGQTWQPAVYIIPTYNYISFNHTFCVSEDNIYVIYCHADNGLHFEFTKSTNLGQTWSEPEEIFNTLQSGDIDIACRGDTIHFVWLGRSNYDDKWETYYIKSENSGLTWSENILLSTYDDNGGNFPSISINETGNIVVTWMDYKYSPYFITGDILARYSYDSGDSWTEEEQLTFAHKVWSQRVLWHSDSVHVVWQDERYAQEDIFYMLSTDNGLTWGEEQRVDDDPSLSNGPDLSLTGENVHIVWNDFREYDQGRGVYYSRWEPEVSIKETNNKIPEDLYLRAYPNPFNSSTVISCSNLEGGDIDIYDITGKLVKQLNSGGGKEGKVTWDATDASSETVSSGVYFIRARGAAKNESIKLIYLR